MPPLTWRPVQIGKTGRKTALVSCAYAHEGLIEEHTIHPDGRVEPSVVCTEAGCGWHEHIVLEGWQA